MPAAVVTKWNGDEVRLRFHRAVGRGTIGIAERISREAKQIVHVITGTLRRSIHVARAGTGGNIGANWQNVQAHGGGAIVEVGSWIEYACLPAGTQVSMADGSACDIADVNVGDEVVSHEGNGQKVTVRSRHHADELVTIRRMGASTPLRLTPDHRVPVRHGHHAPQGWYPRDEIDWVAAADVSTKDFLIERPLATIKEPGRIDLRPLWKKRVGRVGKGYVHRNVLDWDVPVDEDFMRLLGYFLAEGYIVGPRLNAVRFAFHEDEVEYQRDVIDLLQHYVGVSSKTYKNEKVDSHGLAVHCNSVRAAHVFADVGRGAKNKRVPQWAMHAPPDLQLELLKGYWRGDGLISSNRGMSVASASRDLIEGARQMFLRQGLVPQLTKSEGPTNKSAHRVLYGLNLGGGYAKRFANLIGVSPPNVSDRNAARWVGDTVVYRVKDVALDAWDGLVYDLTVKDDHSFVADGVAVSNCVEEVGRGHRYMQPAMETARTYAVQIMRRAFKEEGF